MLQATDKDVELIEKARVKNQSGLWSYFSSSQLSAIVARPLQLKNSQGGGTTKSGGITKDNSNMLSDESV